MSPQEIITSYLSARGRDSEIEEALKQLESTGLYTNEALRVEIPVKVPRIRKPPEPKPTEDT